MRDSSNLKVEQIQKSIIKLLITLRQAFLLSYFFWSPSYMILLTALIAVGKEYKFLNKSLKNIKTKFLTNWISGIWTMFFELSFLFNKTAHCLLISSSCFPSCSFLGEKKEGKLISSDTPRNLKSYKLAQFLFFDLIFGVCRIFSSFFIKASL